MVLATLGKARFRSLEALKIKNLLGLVPASLLVLFAAASDAFMLSDASRIFVVCFLIPIVGSLGLHAKNPCKRVTGRLSAGDAWGIVRSPSASVEPEDVVPMLMRALQRWVTALMCSILIKRSNVIERKNNSMNWEAWAVHVQCSFSRQE